VTVDLQQLNPLTMVLACLAAASTKEAPLETRAFYAATARAALGRLELDVRDLKTKLATIERAMTLQSTVKPAETMPKGRLVGPERTG